MFRDNTPSKDFPYFNFIYKVEIQTLFRFLLNIKYAFNVLIIHHTIAVSFMFFPGIPAGLSGVLTYISGDNVACSAFIARPVTLFCRYVCSFLTLLTFL